VAARIGIHALAGLEVLLEATEKTLPISSGLPKFGATGVGDPSVVSYLQL